MSQRPALTGFRAGGEAIGLAVERRYPQAAIALAALPRAPLVSLAAGGHFGVMANPKLTPRQLELVAKALKARYNLAQQADKIPDTDLMRGAGGSALRER